MTKPLTAQPGTVMAAIDAMERIISRKRQGTGDQSKVEQARDRRRLEVIKKVLTGDI